MVLLNSVQRRKRAVYTGHVNVLAKDILLFHLSSCQQAQVLSVGLCQKVNGHLYTVCFLFIFKAKLASSDWTLVGGAYGAMMYDWSRSRSSGGHMQMVDVTGVQYQYKSCQKIKAILISYELITQPVSFQPLWHFNLEFLATQIHTESVKTEAQGLKGKCEITSRATRLLKSCRDIQKEDTTTDDKRVAIKYDFIYEI